MPLAGSATRWLPITLTRLDQTKLPTRRTIGIWLAALAAAALLAFAVVAQRLQGVTQLGPWGAFGVFGALVLAVAGVSIFSLGATFNYLVSLFHRRPVRQGLFGRPIFDPPLDRQFGWIGLVAAAIGIVVAAGSLVLSQVGEWDIARLWLWLVASALFVLVGVQLVVFWVVLQVLEALNSRENRVEE